MKQIPVVAATLCAAAFAFEAAAQSCTWGGSSAVPAPQAVPLRSLSDRVLAPGRLARDGGGNLYLADPGAGRVVVRDRWGRLVSEKGGLRTPSAVAVDAAGYVLVAEAESGSVSVFDSGWRRVFELGRGDGEFQLPNDIAIDPDPASPFVYVSDGRANLVKVFAANWSPAGSFGGLGRAAGQLDFPAAVHVSAAGEVFVADQNNDRIQVFARDGSFKRCFGGRGGSFTTRFGRTQGITSDGQGRLYVADAFQGYVQVFDAAGVLLSQIGSFGAGPGQLRTPAGLVIDKDNRLFVASTNSGRLEVYGLDAYSDPAVVPAQVELRPDQLREDSKKRFVEARIEIPSVSPGAIDESSITANGVRAELRRHPERHAERDDERRPWLSVKFDLDRLRATLSREDPLVVVAGTLRDGTPFEGSDALLFLPHGPKKEREGNGSPGGDEGGRGEASRDGEHGEAGRRPGDGR